MISLLKCLHLDASPVTSAFFHSKDDERIWLAEWTGQETVKKRRQAMRLDRVALDDAELEEREASYAPGVFSVLLGCGGGGACILWTLGVARLCPQPHHNNKSHWCTAPMRLVVVVELWGGSEVEE